MSEFSSLLCGKISGTPQVLATPTAPLTNRPALPGGQLMSQSTIGVDPETFWSHVAIAGPDECWLWQQSVGSHGYGQTWNGKSVVLAHRVAWELTHGPIPDGQFVLHRCDVKRCVNARAHLFLGTDAENAMDKARKGRAPARLNADTVREMRRRYADGGITTYRLAADYGVDRTTVCLAIRGVTWAHVEEETT